MSGGTDNHLMLISLLNQGITGKAAEEALGLAYMTVNKNAVPNDTQSPFITSGIRIGTPAMTTRGFVEDHCLQVADWMADILDNIDNSAVIQQTKAKVIQLCKQFPVYKQEK